MRIVENGQISNLTEISCISFLSFDRDSIKNEVSVVRTTFSLLYVYGGLKGK